MSERWFNPATIAVAPTLTDDELQARGSRKTDDDEGVDARPVRHRARPEVGEQVSSATIYGRRRRARLKAAAESVA